VLDGAVVHDGGVALGAGVAQKTRGVEAQAGSFGELIHCEKNQCQLSFLFSKNGIAR
jgi:hypothetical protein